MTTYYVKTSGGSDGAAGTSEGAAWATIGKAVSTMVADDTLYVKADGTHSITAAANFAAGNAYNSTRIIGYTTTIGDGGQATIQCQAGYTDYSMIGDGTSYYGGGNSGVHIENLILDANNLARYCQGASNYITAIRCTAKKFTSAGFNSLGNVWRCWATANYAGAGAGFQSPFNIECVASALSCTGFDAGGTNSTLVRCISANNTGASSHGFNQNYTYGTRFFGCVAYGNGGSGFRLGHANAADYSSIIDCISVNNGAYGLIWTGGTVTASSRYDYNALYGNTSGALSGITAGAHDLTITASPFVDGAAGNFALNTTAGAGAVLRAAGGPAFLGISTTGYLDIGAVQHADPAASPVGRVVMNRGVTQY